jgi:hypothetical protein
MWPLRRNELHPRVSGCNWDKPCKTPSKSERTSHFSTDTIFFVPPSLTSFLPFLYHVCSGTAVTCLSKLLLCQLFARQTGVPVLLLTPIPLH